MLKLAWVFYDVFALTFFSYLSYTSYLALNPSSHLRVGLVLWTGSVITLGIVVNYLWELYEPEILADKLKILRRLASAGATLAIAVVLLNYGLFFLGVGRIVLSLTLIGTLGFELLWRSARFYFFLRREKEKLVVVGSGELVKELCSLLATSNKHPYTVTAIATSNGHNLENGNIPVISLSDVRRLVTERKIRHILVSPGEKADGLAHERLIDCLRFGVRFDDVHNLFEELTGRIPVQYFDQVLFLSQIQSIRGPRFRKVKRICDFALAVIGLIFALPLGLLIALLIKLTSRGPIFYRQERVGLNGKVFEFIKFRSMVADAEKNGPVWASPDDERVTVVGRFLRELRLDELPQLWNILIGDMSFVGPRPERPEFVEKLSLEVPFYRWRHLVRPGLTGWAQVSHSYGASVEDARRKLEYDFYYIKHENFLTDLLILARTVSVVAGRMGAR